MNGRDWLDLCLMQCSKGCRSHRFEKSILSGHLNRSMQHFVSEMRDGVSADETNLSSRFDVGAEHGDVGSVPTRGIADWDRAGVWQALVIYLRATVAARWHPSGTALSLALGAEVPPFLATFTIL